MAHPSTTTDPRDEYESLRRHARRLSDADYAQRIAWSQAITKAGEADKIAELETLLKGLVCFGNSRHRIHLHDEVSGRLSEAETIKLGIEHVITVIDKLLSIQPSTSEQRTFPDELRSLSSAPIGNDNPPESLATLRDGLGNIHNLIKSFQHGRQSVTTLPASLYQSLAREIANTRYFNPLFQLDIAPELESQGHTALRNQLREIASVAVHRAGALTELALAQQARLRHVFKRMYAKDMTGALSTLLLTAIVYEQQALISYLQHDLSTDISEEIETYLLRLPSRTLSEHRPEIETFIREVGTYRDGFRRLALRLRMDMVALKEQRCTALRWSTAQKPDVKLLDSIATFLHGTETRTQELLTDVVIAANNPGSTTSHATTEDLQERREALWMFTQVLRAFIAKASAVENDANHWNRASNFRFVHDFLEHFQAMGAHVILGESYERKEVLLETLRQLHREEVLSHEELTIAVSETQQVFRFLSDRMNDLNALEALKPHALDRRSAATRLATYLAHT